MNFILNEKEVERWGKFDKKHRKKCGKGKNDSIGTSCIETVFVGTGIGDIVTVRCSKCGKEKDITDYDRW